MKNYYKFGSTNMTIHNICNNMVWTPYTSLFILKSEFFLEKKSEFLFIRLFDKNIDQMNLSKVTSYIF